MTATRTKKPRQPKEPVLEIRVLDPRVNAFFPLPGYSSIGSAGMDLRAMIAGSTLTLRPGETSMVPTGIAIHIQDRGLAGIIIPRSGLGHVRGIVMGNGIGLIDSDYTGEVFVSVWNRSDVTYTITPGERIAQLVVLPVVQVAWRVVDTFTPTARGANGFGSTGTV